MKIRFVKPYRIDQELVTGDWEITLKQVSITKTEEEDVTILHCKSETACYSFTMGKEYLRKWLREGVVIIIS